MRHGFSLPLFFFAGAAVLEKVLEFARMFKVGTNTITRIIRETGEAFADYMDKELRDLPCLRIELDEQWQYVGCHKGRMVAPEKERGTFGYGLRLMRTRSLSCRIASASATG